MTESTLADAKRAARALALVVRRAAALGAGDDAATELADVFMTALAPALTARSGAIVSGYVAMRDEIDCFPLLAALAARGHSLALPVVAGRGRKLIFRRWTVGGALEDGVFGTRVPPVSAALVWPEIVIVPLLAFDAAGHRLGYGAGYYDLTLAALRHDGAPLAIGVGFAAQELAAVPVGAGDERLDWVATETQAIRCSS